MGVSPRPYNLGARAASVEETKRRILDAAVEEFAENERGAEGASMTSIARRADVAPGTVRYHYEGVDEILQEVVEHWWVDMAMPSADDIDADAPLERRFSTLVRLMYELLERSEPAYEIWRKSPDHPVFVEYGDRFYGAGADMLAKALGPLAGDSTVAAVASVLIDPGFRGTLMARGLSGAQAIEVATDMGLRWLAGRGTASAWNDTADPV